MANIVTHNFWKKNMRLRRSDEFRAVWSGGQSWIHSLLIVRVIPNDMSYSRIGIVASRKVGNAVARNRTRRLLREAARQLYTKINSGWDIVLVARSALVKAKEPEVEDALWKTLHRAKICQDSRIVE